MRWLCVVLVLALSNGCATVSPDQRFGPSEAPGAARLAGKSNTTTLFTWENVTVMSVDGKFVPPSIWTGPDTSPIAIDPGPRRLVIRARFVAGFGNGPYDAIVPIAFTAREKTDYALNYALDGVYIKIWVEEVESGAKASDVIERVAERGPPPSPTIPIFIPRVR